MSRYQLSPRARRDLEGIWDYTAQRWGAAQAEAYIRLPNAASKRSQKILTKEVPAKKSAQATGNIGQART